VQKNLVRFNAQIDQAITVLDVSCKTVIISVPFQVFFCQTSMQIGSVYYNI